MQLKRFANTLVLVEHDSGKLSKGSLSAFNAATQIGQDILAIVLGEGAETVAADTAKVAKVTRVFFSEDKKHASGLAENIAPLLAKLVKENGVSHLIATTSGTGKNILPRVGALLDVQPISDVISIQSPDTFDRPIYAGNAIATVRSSDAVKLFTIRPTAFDANVDTASGAGKVEKLDAAAHPDAGVSELVGQEIHKSDRPDLQTAGVVVAGGRGLKNAENFQLLNKLADKLNAAVGASRAAVDAGYAPNDYQIGQTGKVVAPDLYIAVGISGAIQHLSGMKDSKTIVAINKDTDAPIFQVADYGLVEDLFTAVPKITDSL